MHNGPYSPPGRFSPNTPVHFDARSTDLREYRPVIVQVNGNLREDPTREQFYAHAHLERCQESFLGRVVRKLLAVRLLKALHAGCEK
jgi:hypothetical protein